MPTGRAFTYDRSTLVAEETGRGRRTFLLIHGIGMGRRVFDDLTEHLLPHGRVLAVDLPGYGEAPEPPRTPTIERMADLMAAYVRESAAGPVVLIGHSMGTQVAVEVAARHPAVVERAVLAAPTVDPTERTAVAQLARLAQDLIVESPRVLLLGASEYVRAGPRLRPKMKAMLVHRPEDTYPRVQAPTLVLRGADDYVVSPRWARTVTDLLPDSRLVQIPGHGHETLIRDSGDAARSIIEFL